MFVNFSFVVNILDMWFNFYKFLFFYEGCEGNKVIGLLGGLN